MKKSEIKKFKTDTFKTDHLVFDRLTKEQKRQCADFNESYKTFLDQAKTEREAAQQIIKTAESKGFKDIDKLLTTKGQAPKKVYRCFQDKCVALAVIGKTPLTSGSNILASHIDSPRLDLKQNPLYEDLDIGYLKTHYYGGIRKYHWLAIPLALHGTIIDNNGKKISICIGEAPDDPVFTITDLLPHLAGKLQASKKLSDVFEGEKLNLLAGSLPLGDAAEKDRVKLGILNLLHETYGITEEDFISAEIEAVPAQNAKDIGFDRSMIGAYGQDDRICAYTALQAVLNVAGPKQTAIAFFFDKEEIGSEGSSGAQSSFLEDFYSDLLFLSQKNSDSRTLRKTLINASCLSCDVNAAMDPDFKEVHEAKNAAKLGHGICMTKFTGVGGKSGSSDARAEFVGNVRNIFNKNKIVWQTGELGKIDQGGGGTVAKFLAKYGMDVLDCGPAILSMHSPFEVAGKTDVYTTYLGYKAFLKDNG